MRNRGEQGKPWGGRFQEPTHELVEAFTASISFDRRLFRYDIEGSIAHAKMLARQGIISRGEARSIGKALQGILQDIERGAFEFSSKDEDIHMAIEKALIQRIGDAGAKLHTGRSRNDQVALDVRLYLRAEIQEILEEVLSLKAVFLELAREEAETILPGYTHLQKAQPVLLAHYLLAYREMLDRDESRLRDCYRRVNVLPLGAAALAGTSLPIDRAYVARLLKFPEISRNSMDTVSDRDFIAEFLFVASLIMMHLSRFCEDLILWSTGEFNFVEIADAFTTGSSIMPQKKNPDVAELIRGKTGRIYGNLVALLTLLKGLPMSYNRDLQEDKEPLFDTVDTVKASLKVLAEMSRHLKFHREKMEQEAQGGFSTATDLAEYLVMKGIPFREAHGIVGKLVRFCIESQKELASLSVTEFESFCPAIGEDVYDCLSLRNSVRSRKSYGGTAGEQVQEQIRQIEAQGRPHPGRETS
ncbi:argininosuccinate lyase [Syntrophus gentianae]|uniref:Argininosuccinate lyase n=1 Tax=Syntrophus gentianae TaxID=43775 RepID=A0A1H7W0K3_9BACT|nr:argininosuccinate lyase [Syntrophus gentianae]SEM15112.1 argininosuccinate lyase [Syntrophus gentianae]